MGGIPTKEKPNIPAIVFKTHPPIDRPPLDRQRQCWIDILEKKKVKCIYSDKTLSPKALSLDHFIPWSFVCHNKAWNLVPTLKSINSSKGNQLPCLDTYLEKFIDTQLFLMQLHFAEDSRNWKLLREDLAVDLKLDPGEIYTSPNQFRDKLASTVISQHTLAQQLGFQNWNLQH
ncbi:HNH endonuclease domain-containing protein [Salinimonas lutimaris]|uniref:HNH endonuclease domain-containing protein n=1 Tax=Salinimonas lutimaris TaxID=914153 RepID=UPI001586E94C|nr:HNH endonuclease domain-containing protein [Salinimonas lutimaris]